MITTHQARQPMTDTQLIIGDVYEFAPMYSITFNGVPFNQPYYAKIIGFNSNGNPVVEYQKGYHAVNPAETTIKPLAKVTTHD